MLIDLIKGFRLFVIAEKILKTNISFLCGTKMIVELAVTSNNRNCTII